MFKEKSERQKSIEKIRRQKRRRGRKAKEKMLREKKLLSEKKMLRKPLVFLILAAIIFLAQIACAKDLRAVKLEKFLTSCRPDSPLVNKIHEILYCADKFNLDYRLYVAIAGVESSYGKVYPKTHSNLTGILNGKTKFDSIYDNIYQTHQLIAEGKWYKKYHRTKKLEDFVYTYKGVPPYEPYIRNMRFILDTISAIPIEEERNAQKVEMILTKRKNSPFPQYAPVPDSLISWNSIRYDQLKIGQNLIGLLGIIK